MIFLSAIFLSAESGRGEWRTEKWLTENMLATKLFSMALFLQARKLRVLYFRRSVGNADNEASTSFHPPALRALLASSVQPDPTPELRSRRRLRRGARLC